MGREPHHGHVQHSLMLLSLALASLEVFRQPSPNAPEHPGAAWVAIMGPSEGRVGI